jgi:hypothetical protein
VTLIGNTIGSTAPTPAAISSPTQTALAPASTLTATLPAATNTAAPVASNTPTLAPAFTATPLTIASPTVTSTLAAPAADSIFASGFESGSLSDWSKNANGGGDLSVSPSAAVVGSNGLQAVINDGTAMYVSSDHPNAEPRYRVRFYFDPNSISMANGDAHIILRGYHGSSTVALRVEFGYSAGAYRIRAALVNDGSSWTNTNWVPLSDAPHAIELDWRASTGSGANNGGLTLWVDGAQGADLTGIDNDTRRIERAMLGALAGIDTGTRGTYYFDAFDSRRGSYIGP